MQREREGIGRARGSDSRDALVVYMQINVEVATAVTGRVDHGVDVAAEGDWLTVAGISEGAADRGFIIEHGGSLSGDRPGEEHAQRQREERQPLYEAWYSRHSDCAHLSPSRSL